MAVAALAAIAVYKKTNNLKHQVFGQKSYNKKINKCCVLAF
jgi:hypothetical protein